MPAGDVTVRARFVEEAPTQSFADVSTDAYYYEAVKWAAKNSITGGVGNGLFAPDAPCTRAQIVTFLWRAAGSPEPKNASSFSDVPASAYYARSVAWAVENGITTGTGNGRFSPDATCTRAQSVTFLYRALSTRAEGTAEFRDVPKNAYYADAVAWAAANGITTGIGGGLFGPDNDCTRAHPPPTTTPLLVIDGDGEVCSPPLFCFFLKRKMYLFVGEKTKTPLQRPKRKPISAQSRHFSLTLQPAGEILRCDRAVVAILFFLSGFLTPGVKYALGQLAGVDAGETLLYSLRYSLNTSSPCLRCVHVLMAPISRQVRPLLSQIRSQYSVLALPVTAK